MRTFQDYLFDESIGGNSKRVATDFLKFKMVTMLEKPFNQWDEFHAHIIDEKGNLINDGISNFSNMVRILKKEAEFVAEDAYSVVRSIFFERLDVLREVRYRMTDELTNDEIELLEKIIQEG